MVTTWVSKLRVADMSVSTWLSASRRRSFWEVVFCRYGQSHEIASERDGAGADNSEFSSMFLTIASLQGSYCNCNKKPDEWFHMNNNRPQFVASLCPLLSRGSLLFFPGGLSSSTIFSVVLNQTKWYQTNNNRPQSVATYPYLSRGSPSFQAVYPHLSLPDSSLV
jgi:hypothetical protein